MARWKAHGSAADQDCETGRRRLEEVSKMTVRSQSNTETEIYHGVLDASVQEQEIWQIASCLPHSTVHEIRDKLLGLARDKTFVMNYWLKVCKLRASRGLPMPWDPIH